MVSRLWIVARDRDDLKPSIFLENLLCVDCWGLDSGPRVWKCVARDSIKLLRFYSAVL